MTNRLNNAFTLMNTEFQHTKYDDARAKIMELVSEINKVYRTHMLRSTGKTCDICGKGDNDAHHKVKDVIAGYFHREAASPVLCFNHSCGWNVSYSSFVDKRKADIMGISRQTVNERFAVKLTHIDDVVSDEEIDLHFAQYLAKNLCKQAKERKLNGA